MKSVGVLYSRYEVGSDEPVQRFRCFDDVDFYDCDETVSVDPATATPENAPECVYCGHAYLDALLVELRKAVVTTFENGMVTCPPEMWSLPKVAKFLAFARDNECIQVWAIDESTFVQWDDSEYVTRVDVPA